MSFVKFKENRFAHCLLLQSLFKNLIANFGVMASLIPCDSFVNMEEIAVGNVRLFQTRIEATSQPVALRFILDVINLRERTYAIGKIAILPIIPEQKSCCAIQSQKLLSYRRHYNRRQRSLRRVL